MPQFLKPLLLLSLTLFLYQRLTDGTILFYINRRFVWLTWLALAALLLLVASYHFDKSSLSHKHKLSWRAAILLLVPVLLGWLVPPQPLGTAALANINVSVTPQAALTFPSRNLQQTTNLRRETLLDWVLAFGEAPDPTALTGQTADVTGFVYRRPDFPPEIWSLNRFLISCCVADATAIGLVVRAPETTPPKNDQWVRVEGHFVVETLDGKPMPVLEADTVTVVEQPAHPYVYLR